MRIRIPDGSRALVIYLTFALMIAALFISRATLSLSLAFFVAATTVHQNMARQLQNFFKTPLLLSMSLLFLLPFVSGLWSSNMQEWRGLVRIKLPLLFLPIAFAGSWQLRKAQWRILAVLLIVLVAAGTAWSFYNYWTDRAAISESYLRAKVFQTPLQNDHVRFSWMVAVATLFCLWFVEKGQQWVKWAACIFALWFVVYLHVLAARTGLVSLYIILLGYGVLKMFQDRNKWLVVFFSCAACMLPLLAWQFMPTFQNRIKYFVYDFSFVKSGAYLPGGNDAARMLSFQAGWAVLKNHPFGAGAGDVFDETKNWYSAHVPQMLASDKLYPSSEWLLYGGSTGWIGVLIFTVVMVLPFFYKPKKDTFYWLALCGTAAFTFLFDIGLEVQYGVFLYSFLVLWWWKWLSQSNNTT